jgi:hypothetical protein
MLIELSTVREPFGPGCARRGSGAPDVLDQDGDRAFVTCRRVPLREWRTFITLLGGLAVAPALISRAVHVIGCAMSAC